MAKDWVSVNTIPNMNKPIPLGAEYILLTIFAIINHIRLLSIYIEDWFYFIDKSVIIIVVYNKSFESAITITYWLFLLLSLKPSIEARNKKIPIIITPITKKTETKPERYWLVVNIVGIWAIPASNGQINPTPIWIT